MCKREVAEFFLQDQEEVLFECTKQNTELPPLFSNFFNVSRAADSRRCWYCLFDRGRPWKEMERNFLDKGLEHHVVKNPWNSPGSNLRHQIACRRKGRFAKKDCHLLWVCCSGRVGEEVESSVYCVVHLNNMSFNLPWAWKTLFN